MNYIFDTNILLIYFRDKNLMNYLDKKYNPLATMQFKMNKRLYITIIFLFPQLLIGQAIIKGKIVDNTNNQAVSYANIWILNTNSGTTSSEFGQFVLNVNNLIDTNKVIISSIGYKDTIILLKNIQFEIRLQPIDYQLAEVIVLPTKRKELIVNDLSDNEIYGGLISDTTPKIQGRYFPFKEEYNDFPYIKKIIIYSKDAHRGKLNLRLYSFDTVNIKPIKELIHKNIIIKTKISLIGKAKAVTVDLSEYVLTFPKTGILVGVEWLIIPQNKYKITYTNTDDKNKEVKIMYAPHLGATMEKKGYRYFYMKGLWRKPGVSPINAAYKYSGLHYNPAISLILTN